MTRNQIKVVAVKPKTDTHQLQQLHNCYRRHHRFVGLNEFGTWIQIAKPIMAFQSPTVSLKGSPTTQSSHIWTQQVWWGYRDGYCWKKWKLNVCVAPEEGEKRQSWNRRGWSWCNQACRPHPLTPMEGQQGEWRVSSNKNVFKCDIKATVNIKSSPGERSIPVMEQVGSDVRPLIGCLSGEVFCSLRVMLEH